MKVFLTVIGLKILELGGAFGVWYLLCLLGSYVSEVPFGWGKEGALGFLLALLFLLLVCIIYTGIKANIEWAKKLNSKC